jgi:hypothetical protein
MGIGSTYLAKANDEKSGEICPMIHPFSLHEQNVIVH